jgi:hypothetical protein
MRRAWKCVVLCDEWCEWLAVKVVVDGEEKTRLAQRVSVLQSCGAEEGTQLRAQTVQGKVWRKVKERA